MILHLIQTGIYTGKPTVHNAHQIQEAQAWTTLLSGLEGSVRTLVYLFCNAQKPFYLWNDLCEQLNINISLIM